MKVILLVISVLFFCSCKTSLITYRNGYVFNKQGETIGNYSNGYIYSQEKLSRDIILMVLFTIVIIIL